ncbi:MAG: sugar phosphate isomerase/epimerase [Planctomycetes bacterium]|nr:sugar phosphate isomerase/epimerase [Planctomycetota bacterium]
MPENLLSIRPGSFGKAADRAYDEMKKIGIRYAEVCLRHPSEAKAEKARYEKFGIRAGSISGVLDVQSPECAMKFEPWAAAGQWLDAPVMFVSVKAGDLDRRIVYTRLYECGEVARRYGITVCLETHPDLVTNMSVGLETMKGVDHPNVRINFDTANIYYYNEGIDGVKELKKIRDYVGAIHLKETNGKPKTWYFPTFGDPKGIVNWKETFALMNERGFHGPFTMEIEGCEGDAERMGPEDYIKRVADSVAHLRKHKLVP